MIAQMVVQIFPVRELVVANFTFVNAPIFFHLKAMEGRFVIFQVESIGVNFSALLANKRTFLLVRQRMLVQGLRNIFFLNKNFVASR